MTQLEQAIKVIENFARGMKYDPSTVKAAIEVLNSNLQSIGSLIDEDYPKHYPKRER
jgi:hypothetical protein